MSWSVSIVGTPDAIARELEAESLRQSGYSKEEFDDAKTHLVGLLSQNFKEVGQAPQILALKASGHGYKDNGVEKYRNCLVEITNVAGKLVT